MMKTMQKTCSPPSTLHEEDKVENLIYKVTEIRQKYPGCHGRHCKEIDKKKRIIGGV